MLKVVGASWLQTRISTYILVAVGLLGIGTIILVEFGHVEQDGTYSATVSWNHKGGYRIDFWGQGNDLNAVPLNAARAYYKTGIFESGWSIIEIETSSKYPDAVQAYAAGLLEGSLTWQLIHHHWRNTVNTVCEKRPIDCQKLMRFLRDNTAIIRERAELLEPADPFWHMVRLFYAQLDGIEAGWRFAVRRSRQSVEMETEDFLWLALAADLPNLEQALNISNSEMSAGGIMFIKSIARNNMEPLVAIGHNTIAPYNKMLRLLKKYTFGYHVLTTPKFAPMVPSRSIIMSSYPGALSSHDEFYLLRGENRDLVITGVPLTQTNGVPGNLLNLKEKVMPSVKVMAVNRLSSDGRSWSRLAAYQNNDATAMQWITFEPRTSNTWLVEQQFGITQSFDYTEDFQKSSFIFSIGTSQLQELKNTVNVREDEIIARLCKFVGNIQQNITTLEEFRRVMRGYSQEDLSTDQNSDIELLQKLSYRGDLESVPVPFGVIDSKIIAADPEILEAELSSGPCGSICRNSFKWSDSFPNISHIGHPDNFDFKSVIPVWVWP